jgi:hypothetical protein
MTTGACLCGAVRYEVSGPYKWMTHCHCSMCRKHHGSLYGTTVGVDPMNFRWIAGEDAITHYRCSAAFERPFCKHCGSVVPDTSSDTPIVPAGNLADDLDMKPRAHIFVASRSPMANPIADQLRQFDEYPPGYGASVDRPAVPLKEGVVQGSCLCGQIAFELDAAPRRMVNCHCSRCRRSRGSAHATNVFSRKDNLRWIRGEEHLRTCRIPDAMMYVNSFCDTCGSKMPALFEKVGLYLIPVGVLDTTLDAKPGINIYVSSKAPWFDITDTLPQFEGMPPRERFAELFL